MPCSSFAFITASGHAPGARAIIASSFSVWPARLLTYLLYHNLIDEVGEERAALAELSGRPSSRRLRCGPARRTAQDRAEIVGLALTIVGAEITLRGDSAKRAGGEAKAHEYRPHPPSPLRRYAVGARAYP